MPLHNSSRDISNRSRRGAWLITNSAGVFRPFSGNRKSDTGTRADNAGYYTGTYSGQFQGSAVAVLAADGSIFLYTIDNPTSPTGDGDGGGFGTISAANSLSRTAVPNGLNSPKHPKLAKSGRSGLRESIQKSLNCYEWKT